MCQITELKACLFRLQNVGEWECWIMWWPLIIRAVCLQIVTRDLNLKKFRLWNDAIIVSTHLTAQVSWQTENDLIFTDLNDYLHITMDRTGDDSQMISKIEHMMLLQEGAVVFLIIQAECHRLLVQVHSNYCCLLVKQLSGWWTDNVPFYPELGRKEYQAFLCQKGIHSGLCIEKKLIQMRDEHAIEAIPHQWEAKKAGEVGGIFDQHCKWFANWTKHECLTTSPQTSCMGPCTAQPEHWPCHHHS